MNKIATLLKQNRSIFHTTDLALLWKIDNKNTLLTTIKRYVRKKILYIVHKGFYITKTIEEIDPIELGLGYLHRYAYISTESVLSEAGIINQEINKITFVSNVSKKFELSGREYVARKMADKYLYNDVGVEKVVNINKASVERAVVDLLYFNPKAFIDNKQLVDWDKVKEIKKEIGI